MQCVADWASPLHHQPQAAMPFNQNELLRIYVWRASRVTQLQVMLTLARHHPRGFKVPPSSLGSATYIHPDSTTQYKPTYLMTNIIMYAPPNRERNWRAPIHSDVIPGSFVSKLKHWKWLVNLCQLKHFQHIMILNYWRHWPLTRVKLPGASARWKSPNVLSSW